MANVSVAPAPLFDVVDEARTLRDHIELLQLAITGAIEEHIDGPALEPLRLGMQSVADRIYTLMDHLESERKRETA